MTKSQIPNPNEILTHPRISGDQFGIWGLDIGHSAGSPPDSSRLFGKRVLEEPVAAVAGLSIEAENIVRTDRLIHKTEESGGTAVITRDIN